MIVRDSIPAQLVFLSSAGAPCGAANGVITCKIGKIEGGVHTIVLRFRVRNNAACGVKIRNTATVSSDENDSNPTNNTGRHTATVQCPAPTPTPTPQPTPTPNPNPCPTGCPTPTPNPCPTGCPTPTPNPCPTGCPTPTPNPCHSGCPTPTPSPCHWCSSGTISGNVTAWVNQDQQAWAWGNVNLAQAADVNVWGPGNLQGHATGVQQLQGQGPGAFQQHQQVGTNLQFQAPAPSWSSWWPTNSGTLLNQTLVNVSSIAQWGW